MIPLSFAQRRMWFLHRMEDGGAAYNVPLALRLTGELDVPALRAAVRDVVDRHESLRTIFPDRDGVPYQKIVTSVPDLPVIDVDEARLDGDLREIVRHRFDLTTEPALRARLLRLNGTEHVLVLLLHHIASDGWSMVPLTNDLMTSYRARLDGRAPGWAPLAIQYADFALWQHELLGAESDPDSLLNAQVTFWTGQLDGIPEQLTLPFDRPRPAIASHRGDHLEAELGAELHRSLIDTARSHGVSLFMVLQAGLAALFHRLGAGTDIPIGSQVAGRTEDGLEDLIGFFGNTLLLRTDVSDDPTFADLLDRVRRTDLAAFEHQDVPFDHLVEVLNPVRSSAYQPLVQVMMTLQNAPAGYGGLDGLRVSAVRVTTGTAKFDLSMSVSERWGANGEPAGLNVYAEFAVDLFDRATVESLMSRWALMLGAAAGSPGRRVGSLPVLAEDERERMLRLPRRVLDERLRLVPPGVPGEVYVVGPVGEDHGRSVADPFGPPGSRMCRTGEIARWTKDGELEHLGQAGDHLLIRGFPIDPARIEGVLSAYPGVDQAAVVAGEGSLTAYVTGRVDLPGLRHHLRDRLPDHMVPQNVIVLDRMDPADLPAPEDVASTAGRAPSTPREQVVCELFAEVLGLSAVGVDEDFFVLGGHSMLVATLLSRVRAALGTELSIRDLFEDPTPAGVAAHLGLGGADGALDVLLPLRAGGTEPTLFCLHPLLGLSWVYSGLARKLRADSPIYGVQARGLRGAAPVDGLEEMVADYLTEIRKAQPEGPYRLLGWSLGGALAHGVATRLQAEGQEVELLVVLDTYPFAAFPEIADQTDVVNAVREADILAAFLDFVGVPHDPATDGPLDFSRAVDLLGSEGSALASLSRETVAAIVELGKNTVPLLPRFELQQFRGDLLLFTAALNDIDDRLTPDSWRPYVTGRIENHQINASHHHMLRPEHVTEICAKIDERLRGQGVRCGRGPVVPGGDSR
ncbi:condensation domain-containing protein [Actinoplanes sp. NPDC089786]|uniref:condensation domain-containing protein n=1 Tax=Actinoplanes sp. NPDC089786 TaxID=3155185 RepID=UPI003428C2AB